MHLTLEHFFDSTWVNFNAFGGWMVSLSNVINALASALYLMYVVSSLLATGSSSLLGACCRFQALQPEHSLNLGFG